MLSNTISSEKKKDEIGALDEIVIIREFNAPRERVWKSWTEPEQLRKWWGPRDYTAPFSKIDLHVGGKYLFCMRSPEGKDYWSTGIYRQIVEPSLLECTDSFSDEKGNVVSASYYGMEAKLPLELGVVVTFEEYDGKTKMALRHIGIPSGEMQELTRRGWQESFDKLEQSLKFEMCDEYYAFGASC